jgi:hypothetical protein
MLRRWTSVWRALAWRNSRSIHWKLYTRCYVLVRCLASVQVWRLLAMAVASWVSTRQTCIICPSALLRMAICCGCTAIRATCVKPAAAIASGGEGRTAAAALSLEVKSLCCHPLLTRSRRFRVRLLSELGGSAQCFASR